MCVGNVSSLVFLDDAVYVVRLHSFFLLLGFTFQLNIFKMHFNKKIDIISEVFATMGSPRSKNIAINCHLLHNLICVYIQKCMFARLHIVLFFLWLCYFNINT